MRSHLSFAVVASLVVGPVSASADGIELSNGGRLRGELTGSLRDAVVTVGTRGGLQMRVDREHVVRLIPRSDVEEEYLDRAAVVADTVAARSALAEWCLDNRLADERREQLEAVLRLEPDHPAARRELGYRFVDGAWRSRADRMRQAGLVLHNGRWVSPQERDLLEIAAANRESQKDWFPVVHSIRRRLDGANGDRQREALIDLNNIRDPAAARALQSLISDHPNEEVRIFYVGVLKRLEHQAAVAPLVASALLDVSAAVRSKALEAVPSTHHAAAAGELARHLGHDRNDVVRRAASALAKVGNRAFTPHLIRALSTPHKQTVVDPGQTQSFSLGSDGSIGSPGRQQVLPPAVEAAARTGQLPYGAIVLPPAGPGGAVRTKRITVQVRNEQALIALKAITGEDFGYDERAWWRWWNNVGKFAA